MAVSQNLRSFFWDDYRVMLLKSFLKASIGCSLGYVHKGF